MCPRCGVGGETSLHACHDCPFLFWVWLSLGFTWHVDEVNDSLFCWVWDLLCGSSPAQQLLTFILGHVRRLGCLLDVHGRGRTQPSEHGVMTLNHLGLLMWAAYFWTEYVSTPLATEAWLSVEEIWFTREMGFGFGGD
ncbi:hypothetical protein GOBAR_DD18257 [Gossypium barbadense]|nr:hypothetical protein GOBAR_DD18257 [Gossypium barbadense]